MAVFVTSGANIPMGFNTYVGAGGWQQIRLSEVTALITKYTMDKIQRKK
jgi:hypothetical protein